MTDAANFCLTHSRHGITEHKKPYQHSVMPQNN